MHFMKVEFFEYHKIKLHPPEYSIGMQLATDLIHAHTLYVIFLNITYNP